MLQIGYVVIVFDQNRLIYVKALCFIGDDITI